MFFNTPAPSESWSIRATAAYGLACMLLVCLFDGPYLFSGGVGILDWPKELFYFHVLQSSLAEYGALPVSFFSVPPSLAHFSTLQSASFWGNPEVVSLSPFLTLLSLVPTLSTVAFIKLYFAGHFLLGIAGTGLLARRLGFTPFQGVALFLLAALNPWLSQHLAIGYTPYINFLLIPGLAALLMSPPGSPLRLALAALGNAMIFYQGGLHLFVWFNLAGLAVALPACLPARSPGPLLRVAWVQLCTFALILPKYVATAATYQDFLRVPGTGYPNMVALWGLLTDSASPLFDFPATYSRYGVAFYDASLCVGQWFVGLVGLAALCRVLGLWSRAPKAKFPSWIAVGCALVFLALGYGGNWAWLTRLAPILTSEIYPFRWLFPAYLFTAVFTLAELGRITAGLGGRRLGTALLALAILPTGLAFYQRNASFAQLASSEPDTFEGFSLREYLTHRAVGYAGETLLPAAVTPAGLTLIPPGEAGDAIWLPWLEPRWLREYSFECARPDVFQPENSTVLIVTQPFRPVVITARAYQRQWLGIAGLSVFVVLTLAALGRRDGRPRRARRGRLGL